MREIKSLFVSDISRRIEEVIKVDQADAQIVRDELQEYIVTNALRGHFGEILERYRETPNKPHDGIAIWVSGFFGSGKSSFAKVLGLILENRAILGESAARIFGQRTGDPKILSLLAAINEQIPTDAVIFDVSTDRGIRSGSQSITEIMYRLFLQHLGYARDLDLAELEIVLEEQGRLDRFASTYRDLFGKDWDTEKGKVVLAVQQASRVMHELEPETYTTVDSWRESATGRADINPGLLAERCRTLIERRRPGRSLVFVVDEVGQFVARDVQKMLDLQAVVQSLGRVGRGKIWLVVTSQEKLNELVGGLDDARIELARLMDRFSLQVHLEPSDISEVTSRRVLAKNATAQQVLAELFKENRGRLVDHSRLTSDIRLPELTRESFIDLYPLLPYHIDFIIQVVSGLRTQGGASKHVGGAARTIIKLAQQLLIHPAVNLADLPVGRLVRADQIYDLVAGNIASEIRGKIDGIAQGVEHPLAQAAAKAVCLLQYVKSVHRSAENIAALLLPDVQADTRLPEVKAALAALVQAQKVRLGDDGYRIPTPAEDDWERQRSGLSPKPGDSNRILAEQVDLLWQPQPAHTLRETRQFKAGLLLNGKEQVAGDIPFHVTLADIGADFSARVAEMRERSHAETRAVFWVAALDEAMDAEVVAVYRSKELLARKERSAQSPDEQALIVEEKGRLRRHQEELRRRLRQALLGGTIFYRGNDRSPDEGASDVGRTAARVLGQVLPEVFHRFDEAAARVQAKDLEALLNSESLQGLTPVFSNLRLVRERAGKVVFETESGPLTEVLQRIENRASYGDVVNGKYLAEELAGEPFGWDFDVVRLLVVCLLRAGKVEATSKGLVLDSALSLEARSTFPNNNLFRQASFRPKVTIDYQQVVQAYKHCMDVFGRDVPDIEQAQVVRCIREEAGRYEATVQEIHTTLVREALPGVELLHAALDQLRALRGGSEDQTIQVFNAAYNEVREAIQRAADLQQHLDAPQLHDLNRARRASQQLWPALVMEGALDDDLRAAAAALEDVLARETFFRELPLIDQLTWKIEDAHTRQWADAAEARSAAYRAAVEQLKATPGWESLSSEQQAQVTEPLERFTTTTGLEGVPIPQIRAEVDACPQRLRQAEEEFLRLIGGARVERVNAAAFFKGGIETEEQLDAALAGLRDECAQLLAAGRKVLVQ